LEIWQLIQVHFHSEKIALLDESSFPIKIVLQALQDEWLITAIRRKPRRDAGDCHRFGCWQVAAAYAIWCCLEIKAGWGGPKLGVNVVQEYWGSFDMSTNSIDQLG
jgi:hypothetical protein